MRYLIVVRHASAEDAAPGRGDVERILSPKGRRQCARLRAWAEGPEALGRFGPVTAVVSAAARTRETFERAFAGTALVAESFESAALYNGRRHVGVEEVVAELVAHDAAGRSLMVVGHNPTVREVVDTLGVDVPLGREAWFPKGGVVVLEIGDDRPIGTGGWRCVGLFDPSAVDEG
ncbi:MAG: SixA phosphatase family protein [Acidimicrobiales bacterium]